MSVKDSPAERHAAILQDYKDHKLTSTQAREEIKKLKAEIRRGKKKNRRNQK